MARHPRRRPEPSVLVLIGIAAILLAVVVALAVTVAPRPEPRPTSARLTPPSTAVPPATWANPHAGTGGPLVVCGDCTARGRHHLCQASTRLVKQDRGC